MEKEFITKYRGEQEMIFAYLAYGICALAVSIGIGFIVAKADDIEDRR